MITFLKKLFRGSDKDLDTRRLVDECCRLAVEVVEVPDLRPSPDEPAVLKDYRKFCHNDNPGAMVRSTVREVREIVGLVDDITISNGLRGAYITEQHREATKLLIALRELRRHLSR